MKIQVLVKNVFGNDTIYPVCDQAKIFAALVGQKTLTLRDISLIEKLGFRIENVTPVAKIGGAK